MSGVASTKRHKLVVGIGSKELVVLDDFEYLLDLGWRPIMPSLLESLLDYQLISISQGGKGRWGAYPSHMSCDLLAPREGEVST